MSSSNVEVQYWDSNMFISLLTGADPERVKVIKELLDLNKRGAVRIITSTFTIAEVRPHPNDRGLPIDEFETAQELFESDRIELWVVTPRIAAEAARIGYENPSVTPTDCVHIATAIEAKADVLFTFDGAGTKRRKQGAMIALSGRVGDPPLRIREPSVSHGPLFDMPDPVDVPTEQR
jgi:predicted nucleic acid-binding protein